MSHISWSSCSIWFSCGHLEITARKKVNYVHVISGEVMIADHLVKAGDALVFDETATITALQDSQMIWFDLP